MHLERNKLSITVRRVIQNNMKIKDFRALSDLRVGRNLRFIAFSAFSARNPLYSAEGPVRGVIAVFAIFLFNDLVLAITYPLGVIR